MAIPIYGVAYEFCVGLVDRSNRPQLKGNPTIASGDFLVSTDGGSFVNLTTIPDVYPATSRSVRIRLSASEMTGEKVVVVGVDAAGAEWDDVFVCVTPEPVSRGANVLQINGLGTDGNNATLNLKKLNIVNSTGDAITATSTGSNGRGIIATGHGTSEGMKITGGTDGLACYGGAVPGAHGIRAQSGITGSGLFAGGKGVYAGISAYNTTAPTGGGPGMSIQSYDSSGSANGLDIATQGGKSIFLYEGVVPVLGSIAGNIEGNVTGNVDGNVGGNVVGSVGSLASQAKTDVNNEVVDALVTDTYTEPGSVPSATASLKDKIGWIQAVSRNKITQTATTQTLRNDGDSGNVSQSTVSDDGTTFTRGKFA